MNAKNGNVLCLYHPNIIISMKYNNQLTHILNSYFHFLSYIFFTNYFIKRIILLFRYRRMIQIHIACASSAKFTVGGKIIIRTSPHCSTRLLCDRLRWKAITLHP